MEAFADWRAALAFIGVMVALGLFAGEVGAFVASRIDRALGKPGNVADKDAWRVVFGLGAFLVALGVVAVVGWG